MAALIRLSRFLLGLLVLFGVVNGVVDTAAATTAVVHDPWLARLQVGAFRNLDDVEVNEKGWPVGILAPLGVDPGWLGGAAEFFVHDRLPRRDTDVAWRLALPAYGSSDASEMRYRQVRRIYRDIRRLAPLDAVPLTKFDPVRGPWSAEATMLQASRAWQAERWTLALRACDRLLSHREDLDASATFVWTLRRLALRDRLGLVVDLTELWPTLGELGSYDTRSGWTIWTALRRHRGQSPIPAGQETRATGILMAAAGRFWLESDEFARAGFPDETVAGVGAILLPKAELPAHFERWPEPPADGRLQGYWLRGQRRRSGTADNIEKLAALPGLVDGHRLDLWRRASEKRLLRGQWSAGLQDLQAGVTLFGSEASRGVQGRLREWTVQALALALAKKRPQDARWVVDVAEQAMSASDREVFRRDAAALLNRIDRPGPGPGANTTRELAETLVRQGESPNVGVREGVPLPDPIAWRHELWDAWATWGLALLDDAAKLSAVDRAYGDGLRALQAAESPVQRHATGCALAAVRLGSSRLARALVDFALQRDVERASLGEARPTTSPIEKLREPGPWRKRATILRGHALLGAALALGDERGQLAVAVRLPSGGVDDAVRWRFWYPVPSDPAVRDALQETDLPPELLLAIARNESLFEPAIRSRAGALGYMQIMPFHYTDPAGPPTAGHWSHPATSLQAGARILSSEVAAFKGDPYCAVAAYNAGRGAVRRWQKQLGGVASRDLFWAWISYPETRGYTLRVLRDREVYRSLLAGPR